MGGTGFEPANPTTIQQESSSIRNRDAEQKATDSDAKCATATPAVTIGDDSVDPIEEALAAAITKASTAGAWDAVQALTAELRARREARSGIVRLDAERAKRERKG